MTSLKLSLFTNEFYFSQCYTRELDKILNSIRIFTNVDFFFFLCRSFHLEIKYNNWEKEGKEKKKKVEQILLHTWRVVCIKTIVPKFFYYKCGVENEFNFAALSCKFFSVQVQGCGVSTNFSPNRMYAKKKQWWCHSLVTSYRIYARILYMHSVHYYTLILFCIL